MISGDLLSLVLILFFAGILAYQSAFFHDKKLGHFSLLQVLYLIIFPGFMFVVIYSHMRSILVRPIVGKVFIPDSLLEMSTLLAFFISYGGTAVHAVTKMLSETALRKDISEVGRLNKYFHLQFSHNMMISGGIFTMIGLTLLELNHTPVEGYEGLFSPVIKGVIMGILLILAMYMYTRSKDQYVGRWSDLKATFFLLWVGLILLLYVVRQVDPKARDYQLLIPSFLGLSVVALLNVGLVVRKLKSGKLKVRFSWKRLIK